MGGLANPLPDDQRRPLVPPLAQPPMVAPAENPILTEIDQAHASLSPPAKAAIDQAHTLMGGSAPATREPVPIKGPTPSALAQTPLSAPSAQPENPITQMPIGVRGQMPLAHVQTPLEAERDRLAEAGAPGSPEHHGGSYISQIRNPFGRGLLSVLDAVGRGIAPGIEEAIPGTQGHHDYLVHKNAQAIAAEQGSQAAADKSAQDQAAAGLTGAQTEHMQAETQAIPATTAETEARTGQIQQQTANLAQNLPKDAFELWFRQNPGKTITDYEKDVAAGKQPSSAFDLWVRQNPGKTYSDYQADVAANKQPTSAFELWLAQNPKGKYEDFEKAQQQITAKPITAEHANALNAAWAPIAQKYHLPTNQFHEGMTSAEAQGLVQSFNDVVGKAQGGQNITIRQQSADTAAANKKDAQTEKEYQKNRDALTKEFSTVNTQLDALEQARKEISSNPVGQALGTIKTLVAIAGGRGSGVRITQAELNSIAQARGIKGAFEGWVNQMAGRGKLSDEQVKQINDVLGDVEKKATEKQLLLNDTLDKLNDAKSPEEIRKIEQEYRHASTGSGAGTATVYHEGDKVYNIPTGQEKDFEKDHPKAKRQ